MGETKQEAEELVPASEGAGPLLQRDYWAVIRACCLKPSEVADLVRRQFCAFPPESLAVFRRKNEAEGPLDVGDELDIDIRMAGPCAVRVVHADDHSLTLGTLKGHPETGIITFGAYRNGRGDVVFHIRSRARSGSPLHFAGFLTAGEPMQTNTWTDFIDRLAHMVGDGVVGAVQAETQKVDDDERADAVDSPTFIARGD